MIAYEVVPIVSRDYSLTQFYNFISLIKLHIGRQATGRIPQANLDISYRILWCSNHWLVCVARNILTNLACGLLAAIFNEIFFLIIEWAGQRAWGTDRFNFLGGTNYLLLTYILSRHCTSHILPICFAWIASAQVRSFGNRRAFVFYC